MQSWLNLLRGFLFSTLNLALYPWTDRSPFCQATHYGEDYVVFSYQYWQMDFNHRLLAENQESQGARRYQHVLPMTNSTPLDLPQWCYFLSKHRIYFYDWSRLSLDQHRTAFSSLYETRTHPFGVAATETDLGFRNHYTL